MSPNAAQNNQTSKHTNKAKFTSVGMAMCQIRYMASAATTFTRVMGRILRMPTATSA